MKNLVQAGKLLLLDMAATLAFLVLYLLTHNVVLSVALGMALGTAQIGWQLARRKPIDTMQWMSLFLVLGAGAVTLITDDPRFVMIKPSVIYVIFGYIWSGLMFFSAILNVIVALNFSVVTWSVAMSIYGIISKAALFLLGYAVMRTIAVARRRRQQSRDIAGDRPRDAEWMLANDLAAAPIHGAAPASAHSASADDGLWMRRS